MKLTLDEAKEILIKHKSPYYNCAADAETNEAIYIAACAIQKIQQIELILASRPSDMINSNPTLRVIRNVIENENDN